MQRNSNESFEEYRVRRAKQNELTKEKTKGNFFWRSSKIKRAEKKKLNFLGKVMKSRSGNEITEPTIVKESLEGTYYRKWKDKAAEKRIKKHRKTILKTWKKLDTKLQAKGLIGIDKKHMLNRMEHLTFEDKTQALKYLGL